MHQYISHLTSMQAEVVRAANEWQDKVVQRRVLDRQPETVRAFKQGNWVVQRHFDNRRPTKLSPLWIGPYQVLDHASNGMYRRVPLCRVIADIKRYLGPCVRAPPHLSISVPVRVALPANIIAPHIACASGEAHLQSEEIMERLY